MNLLHSLVTSQHHENCLIVEQTLQIRVADCIVSLTHMKEAITVIPTATYHKKRDANVVQYLNRRYFQVTLSRTNSFTAVVLYIYLGTTTI